MGQGRKNKKLARRKDMIAQVEADATVAHLPKWKRMRVVAERLTSNALAKRQRHKDKMAKKKAKNERLAAARKAQREAAEALTAATASDGAEPAESEPAVVERTPKANVLLVLDVDGVLIQREQRPKKGKPPKGWVNVNGRPWRMKIRADAVQFVRFCLSTFHVGVWSAMSIQNLKAIMEQLLGVKPCRELLFMWGRDHTTPTGVFDVDNPGKEKVRKRLETIWEQVEGASAFKPNATLLIDDDEWKAEGNPPHTAVHPTPWGGKRDQMLRKKGGLRKWLQGLAANGDVPAYVSSTSFAEAVAEKASAKAHQLEQKQKAEAAAHEEGKTTRRERRRLAQAAALAEKHARGEQTSGELKRERQAQRKEERAAKRAKTVEL